MALTRQNSLRSRSVADVTLSELSARRASTVRWPQPQNGSVVISLLPFSRSVRRSAPGDAAKAENADLAERRQKMEATLAEIHARMLAGGRELPARTTTGQPATRPGE